MAKPLPGKRWYEYLEELDDKGEAGKDGGAAAKAPEVQQGPCCSLHVVSTIRAAAAAVKTDADWKESGVQEMLRNALRIAEQGDCTGAVTSAIGVLAFLQGRESALSRLQGTRVPWADRRDSPAPDSGVTAQSAAAAVDQLHSGHGDSAAASPRANTDAEPAQTADQGASGIAAAAAHAIEAVGGSQDLSSGGSLPAEAARPPPGRREIRKIASDPERAPAAKRARGSSPPLPLMPPPRSLSDPATVRASLDSLITTAGARPRLGASLDDGVRRAGSITSDERFPGHNCVEEASGYSGTRGTSAVSESRGKYWAGKVKHKLGASTVELFFLSALLPTAIIEHMPQALFITELVPRSGLAVDETNSMMRCRLDFVTTRQLRKLRTLAELRLAAVSVLQHCSITLVPFIDNIGSLRIIGFVKTDIP